MLPSSTAQSHPLNPGPAPSLPQPNALPPQKCLKLGHHTYECTNPRPYTARPSRSKELSTKGLGALGRDKPSVEVPDEFKAGGGVGLADKILQAKAAEREKERAKASGRSKKERERSASPKQRRRWVPSLRGGMDRG